MDAGTEVGHQEELGDALLVIILQRNDKAGKQVSNKVTDGLLAEWSAAMLLRDPSVLDASYGDGDHRIQQGPYLITIRGMKTVRTPCIGICSTTSVGDRICRGCKRFSEEVIHWNNYSETEKRAVQARINQLTSQIMADKFRIVSVQKLEQVMQDFRIFYDPDLSPYFWLHQLLQKHLYRLGSLSEAGVMLQQPYLGRDVRDLLVLINEQLQVLSEAHYERYCKR